MLSLRHRPRPRGTKRVLTLLAAVALSLLGTTTPASASGPQPPGAGIVGGRPIAINQVPYTVSVQGKSHRCGGTIISASWIVTTTHCVSGASPDSLNVRAGTATHNAGGTTRRVAQVIAHPDFDPTTIRNDIALLRLTQPLTFSSVIRSALLARTTPAAGTALRVTGWGATSEGGNVSTNLRSVQVPVTTRAVCQQAYGAASITAGMLCAGVPEGGKDACQADSGGPAVNPGGALAGIISWGKGCGSPGFPGVYTDVAYFRSWVSTQTGISF